jgi:hypothetical protein
MNQEQYDVTFDNGDGEHLYTILAFNQREAIILAQAEQIKRGLQWQVYKVVKV